MVVDDKPLASLRGELASLAISRHAVRLVVVDRARDELRVAPFAALATLLRDGDLVVVNDAATLPASLHGHTPRGEVLELRLSAPPRVADPDASGEGAAGPAGTRLYGVLFGAGDHRTRTEDRPPPPPLAVGDRVRFAALEATIVALAGRRAELAVSGTPDMLWQALYAAGRPVQYAHRTEPLELWTVQTAYAARPWAAEMPSAGRPLTWDVLLSLRRAGVQLARLTHAAGVSSTGDDALDRALPWPERYELPRATVAAVAATRARGGRVIAVGTTVVRALESAALEAEQRSGELAAGSGLATLRLDAAYVPRVVDGLLSGLHSPGESHFELLQAFAPREQLLRALELASAHGLSAHELGDACLIV
ncbi:MAG: S-adenosylmethionine:tRNA ribosyltransferase-isomerase [Acidobacteriota bacterium]